MRRTLCLSAVLVLLSAVAWAWEPPAIFAAPWWQTVQYDYQSFPYDHAAATALLSVMDRGAAVQADQRGFLETERLRVHFLLRPAPAQRPQAVVGLVYQKRTPFQAGDWILVEQDAASGATRELARAMTLLVRPLDLDNDGVWELHLTEGEINAGYAMYRDRVLRWDSAGYAEIFSINSADTAAVVPRHATVDRDNRLTFRDLDNDGVSDMTVLTRVQHFESKRRKDPAVLTLTEYLETDQLFKSGRFQAGQQRQVGRVEAGPAR